MLNERLCNILHAVTVAPSETYTYSINPSDAREILHLCEELKRAEGQRSGLLSRIDELEMARARGVDAHSAAMCFLLAVASRLREAGTTYRVLWPQDIADRIDEAVSGRLRLGAAPAAAPIVRDLPGPMLLTEKTRTREGEGPQPAAHYCCGPRRATRAEAETDQQIFRAALNGRSGSVSEFMFRAGWELDLIRGYLGMTSGTSAAHVRAEVERRLEASDVRADVESAITRLRLDNRYPGVAMPVVHAEELMAELDQIFGPKIEGDSVDREIAAAEKREAKC